MKNILKEIGQRRRNDSMCETRMTNTLVDIFNE